MEPASLPDLLDLMSLNTAETQLSRLGLLDRTTLVSPVTALLLRRMMICTRGHRGYQWNRAPMLPHVLCRYYAQSIEPFPECYWTYYRNKFREFLSTL